MPSVRHFQDLDPALGKTVAEPSFVPHLRNMTALQSNSSSPSFEPPFVNATRRKRLVPSNIWRGEVDTTACALQMNAYYFMAGFMNTISYSATMVWCGFQSGNTTQLGIAIARLWEGESTRFRLADRQALGSLLSFIGGALIVRLGDVMGSHTRGWMMLGTFVQALLTMAAAISIWKSNQGYPGISDDRFTSGAAWTDAVSYLCLIFMSASMGLQGLMSVRLKTQSGATLPLTTTWCELIGVDALFSLNRLDTARDQRLLGIFSVILGAISARGLTFRLGSPGSLAIGVGIRVVIALSWLMVPTVEKLQGEEVADEKTRNSGAQLGNSESSLETSETSDPSPV